MNIMEKIADVTRDKVRSFLQIEPAKGNTFYISETLDHESNVYKNRIWYRGDSDELMQLYKSMPGSSNKSRFWAAVPTTGLEIRKIHTGIAAMIVNVLKDVVISDLNDINVPDKYSDSWDKICDENKINNLIGQGVKETLITGDGAFKISIDTNMSEYPIVEFYPAERVEYIYKRGRLQEIVFKTEQGKKKGTNEKYILYEHYGFGYVESELYFGNKKIKLDDCPNTNGMVPRITFDNSFMMAVQMMFDESSKYKGRGLSIIDSKSDAFDSLDEAWSQWMDAVRQGRATKYIPEGMLPRNPYTGEAMKPNAFDNAYIEHSQPRTENANPSIRIEQPNIPHESYIQTYITALDLCLQGVISPSTLGIDTKKLDNAESQREKEKTTLYTRNNIVAKLQEVIPELVNVIFKSYAVLLKQPLEELEIEAPFGEYANPSFESQVETISKAKSGGIMSIEASVDELYGDTRNDEWKKEEVMRLKKEQGIEELEEVSVGDAATNLNMGGIDESISE